MDAFQWDECFAKHPHINPAKLELEVLETSALAEMAQVSQVIADCAKIGVKFALDDFGQLGCELGQGYGIARPMLPNQMPDWVTTWQPDSAWSD